MLKRCVPAIAAALIISHGQTAGAGETIAPPIRPPAIHKVEVNDAKRSLIISGTNFGTGAPLVSLGGQTLPVTSFSPDRIVATMPGYVAPATYHLTLTDAADVGKSVSFNMEIHQPYRNTPHGR